MGVAVSRQTTNNSQDLLAGTVLGVLPSAAPFYDVEVNLASYNDNVDTADMQLPTTIPTVSLLAGGAAVLSDADVPFGVPINGNAMRSDSPIAIFRAPGGTRLTMNTNNITTGEYVMVYVEAREAMTPSALSVGHMQINQTGDSDVLSGSPIGSLPTTAAAWNLNIQIAVRGNFQQSNHATVIVGGDTICEGFQIPQRKSRTHTTASRIQIEDFPVEERDTLISTLAQGGDRVVLNLAGTGISYRVWATPVA